jgi:class 3 adenylate cyclase/tetratricopeptide (TPR) repeat protein
MRCQDCGHENRADASFCLACGARLQLACGSCGRALPGGARFCDGCGAPVSGAAASPPRGAPAGPEPYTPPPHLAEKIRRDHARLQGERREVTVLFIDAVGSTSASERLDPEELHRVVQACTETMIDAVNRFEGTVTQFRGDGIMAVFGAPIAHEDSARRAVAAAVAMRDRLEAYRAEIERDGGRSFRYRIGLNTGPVIVGSIGSDLTMDYTAIGDTVNLAARMEQAALQGRIYITQQTARLVEPYFELRGLGLTEVKGKAEGVQVFEVLRELRARTRLDAASERGLTPYVGRAEQLAQLQTMFDRAREGEGQVVFVTGEAGIGKSRLLLEFRRTLDGPDIAWLEGRCISWGRTFPYLPITGIVRGAFDLSEHMDEREASRRIDQATGGWQRAGDAPAAPALKHLLSLDPGDESFMGLDPRERRTRVIDALRALVRNTTRARPLVVVVEDLHWADEQSEDALSVIIDVAAAARALIIVTSRPGFAHRLGDRSFFSRLALRNLGGDESRAMLQAALDAAGIPPELERLVVSRAEGNPFYIEEVTRSLVESKVVRREDGRLVLARAVTEAQIPSTIQEVVLSRLDRLDPVVKDVVQVAAVIGREFSVPLLQRAAGSAAVQGALDELKALELVYEVPGGGEPACAFKHALTQEVALSTLLTRRRSELHCNVAEAIVAQYSDRLTEHAESLAHHFFEGEQWERACEYAKQVAYRAESLHAPRTVIEHVTRAIEAAHRCDPECCEELLEPELYRLRGNAHEAIGDFEKARIDHEAAIKLAERRGDRETLWRSHADLGMLWAGRDYARTGPHYERAHEVALQTGDQRAIAHSLNRLGNWRINMDYATEGIGELEHALEIFRGLGDRRGVADSLDFLTSAYGMVGDMHRGLAAGLQAAEYFREANDRQRLSGVLSMIGFFAPAVETLTTVPALLDGAEREALAAEALGLARDIGWRANEAFVLIHSSMHEVAGGNLGLGIEEATRGLAMAEEIGHLQWQTAAHVSLGESYRHCFARDLAVQHHARAADLAEATKSAHWFGTAIGFLALAFLDSGQTEQAEITLAEHFPEDLGMISLSQRERWRARAEIDLTRGRWREALEVIERLGATAPNAGSDGARAVPWLALLRAQALLGLEQVSAAETALDDVIQLTRSLRIRTIEWRALAALASLRVMQGRPKDAAQPARRAVTLVDEMAATLTEERLRRALTEAPALQELRAMARAGNQDGR